MSNIVNVLVNVLPATIPNTLQATGVIISQGATTVTPSTATLPNALGTSVVVGNALLITQPSDLTSHLSGSQAITGMTWSSSVVTVTISSGHGLPTTGSETIPLTITGVTFSGTNPNGTQNCTVTSTTQFTFPLTTTFGTIGLTSAVFTEYDVTELVNQVATYFAQSSAGVACYVLELGAGDPAQGVTALQTWITNNPLTIYGCLLPDNWAAEPTFLAFLNLYTSPKSCIYFYFNSQSANYTTYIGIKSACNCAMSPNAANTEQLAANLFAIVMNYAPSSTNKVPQAAYTFLYGATKWPVNNQTLLTLETDNVNYAASGAEGGLSNVILKKGVYGDGSQLNHWYGIDWVNIQGHQALANTIILGSNNTQNPLYYDQKGINALTATGQLILDRAVSFGLIGGNPIMQAIPYAQYVAINTTDYANGIYNGLYATVATQQGFITITFNLTISNLAP